MNPEAAPPVVLSVAYWLHMLATVAWLGGLFALAFLVIPGARQALDGSSYLRLMVNLERRLQQVGWFSLTVLGVTGMFQMSSNPSYQGFMEVENPWAVAILAKHAVIGLMVVAAAYMTWGVFPALNRLAILEASGRGAPPEQVAKIRARQRALMTLNLLLAGVILLLTAVARVYSG